MRTISGFYGLTPLEGYFRMPKLRLCCRVMGTNAITEPGQEESMRAECGIYAKSALPL